MNKVLIVSASAAALLLAMFLGTLGTTGLFLGLIMFLAIWLVYTKMPNWLRNQTKKHPLIADVGLTGSATYGASALFGTGLVLALAAMVCGVLVSGALKLENGQLVSC